MIDKYKIPLKNKNTKKIIYTLHLDGDYWLKSERNVEGRTIHLEDSKGELKMNQWIVIGNEILY